MPVAMPSDNRRSRFMLWTAHHSAWIWAGTLGFLIAEDTSPHSRVLAAIAWAAGPLIVWLLWSTWRHGLALCPLCARATPLDGPAMAQRKSRQLRWAHASYRRGWGISFLVVFAALLALSFFWPRPALWAYWMYLDNTVMAYLMSVHQPLQPWCPQCHWDDGGDHEEVPEPVPPMGEVVMQ